MLKIVECFMIIKVACNIYIKQTIIYAYHGIAQSNIALKNKCH